MTIQNFNSPHAAPPIGQYPHAKQVGQFLFLSGIGPRETDSSIPGNRYNDHGQLICYDLEKQVHSVFNNIKHILKEHNLELNNLVDVTIFLTNMTKDFERFNSIYQDYFPDKDTAPCRTTVEIKSLPTDIAVEFKCIAFKK